MPLPYLLLQASGSDQADEWLRLGLKKQLAGDLPEAQANYMQALRLDPRHAAATQNLAIVFAQSNLPGEAMLALERAAMFDGKYVAIPFNTAQVLWQADRIEDAIAAAKRAIAIDPSDVQSQITLAMLYASAGDPTKALAVYEEILAKDPKHPAAGPNSCFIQTLCDCTPAELLKNRQRFYEANRFTGKVLPHGNDKRVDRVLRVGYVGGDFKGHSAAFIFSRVLFHHTPAVEMYLYSSLPVQPDSDGKTKRFKELAGERWRDISAMSDEDADKLIREDRIDILVDLAGHTNGGRLPLFTRKAAPVQVTAWGFAHGTGIPEIDYFFADPIAIPDGERQHFAEKIWDLPCIVTMEEPQDYALNGVSHAPFRRNGYVTFGVYSRYEKMNDDCIRTYGEILKRVPDSKIEFKDHAYKRPDAIRRIMRLMPDIAQERLLFSIGTTHPEHMLTYQQADLCLDEWPHGGGVVCMEQLYMGVPILAMYGKQPSGRSASSVLTQMGRTDWIAYSPEEFVEKAVALAENPKPLADARKTLRKELLESPVVKDYHLAVERAYQDMWRAYCASH